MPVAVVDLKFDANGLIPAIAQDLVNGDILMVAWMDRAAVQATLDTGKATFFSRSRGRAWVKGETSGHFLHVASMHADCDADTLLLRVRPAGPACHTGRPTCFFRGVSGGSESSETRSPADAAPIEGTASLEGKPPATFLGELEREILDRQKRSTGERSYTRSLLDAGASKIAAKLREEAGELGEALASETSERVASEAADVIYHLLVGLRLRDVSIADVLGVLAARAGVSGHAEKASRGRSSPE